MYRRRYSWPLIVKALRYVLAVKTSQDVIEAIIEDLDEELQKRDKRAGRISS